MATVGVKGLTLYRLVGTVGVVHGEMGRLMTCQRAWTRLSVTADHAV